MRLEADWRTVRLRWYWYTGTGWIEQFQINVLAREELCRKFIKSKRTTQAYLEYKNNIWNLLTPMYCRIHIFFPQKTVRHSDIEIKKRIT